MNSSWLISTKLPLRIDVHEVRLGISKGKVVVVCKDFTREIAAGNPVVKKALVHFHNLKNG